MSTKMCSKCGVYESEDSTCRKHPAQIIPLPKQQIERETNKEIDSRCGFPMVEPFWWCSEFEIDSDQVTSE